MVSVTINLLEAIRFLEKPIRFYNASSSECFGDVAEGATEERPFTTRSPYAVAKSTAHWLVTNYREAYDLFACSGFLFNHESPLRPARFVTRKITSAACRIANGSKETLNLGNLEIIRDWGWAPEYVEAMWLVMQQENAADGVVATGKSHSLKEFFAASFEQAGPNWEDHVKSDPDLFRPTVLQSSWGDASKIRSLLNWSPKSDMFAVVSNMITAEACE